MKRQALMMLVCGLLLVLPSSSWARKWTSNTGKYSIEAELVEVRDKKVTLRKPDGSVVTLPVARLSDQDRRYLKTLKKSTAKQSTLDDGAKNSPSGPKVSGTINGHVFTPDKIELEGGTLTLRQGKDFFADLKVSISLFLDREEIPEGKTYQVAAKERFGTRLPHIHMEWKEAGKRIPESETYFDGYAMKLEFGKVSDKGKLPGKIMLRLPDKARSSVVGTFAISVFEPGTGQISGSITVPPQSKELDIWVGCLGKNSEGKLEGPGTGFKLSSSAISASSTSWKPRSSYLSWDQKTQRLIHKHINRPPGWYLVSVRGSRPDSHGGGSFKLSRGGYYDWKWVKIKEDAADVTVDLAIDPSNLGTVEVTLRGPTKKSAYVTYLPLDENGQLPYPEAHAYLSSTSSAKIEGGKAVIRGLREGKYQIAMRPWRRGTRLPNTKIDVLVKRGTTTKVELTPPPAVPSKRTRTPRKKEEPKRKRTRRKKEDRTGLPDLVVTKVYLNEGGYMRALVKNRGTAHATEHIVEFFIDGKRRASHRCKAIEAGVEFEVSAMSLLQFPGKHVVKVVADADNKIPESDETNNSMEATLP